MFETFQTLINAGGYDLADFTEPPKNTWRTGGDTSSHRRRRIPATARAHHHIQSWCAQASIFRNLHWCFQVIDWGCSFRAMV